MLTAIRRLFLALTIVIAIVSSPAVAQVVISTVPTDFTPYTAGVNSTTNKIYVANECGTDGACASPGTVTVINGATLGTQSVAVSYYPFGIAVNSVTNKIYTATCGGDSTCSTLGTVTVIDGATLSTTDVTAGVFPQFVAVNSVTNKIYVANECGSDVSCGSPGSVTVINGSTLATQTVTAGYQTWSVAVDASHNKIYAVNQCGDDINCTSVGTVTVIDGNTLNTQTVNVGYAPFFAAVNPTTNKIYVANNCGTDVNCAGLTGGTVTVIDGATLGTQTVNVGIFPFPIAVNASTNKIYVGNRCGSDPNCVASPSVSVIDGTTLSSTPITICPANSYPYDVTVNSTTNQIYLPCFGRTDTITGLSVANLDGATNVITPIAVGDYPATAAINSATNKIYVPNVGDATASVIGGNTKLQFVTVTPCRLVDTRPEYGGSGPIEGGLSEDFILTQLGGCNIPPTAAAYSLNVTVVPPGRLGFLTIWPTAEYLPGISLMNSLDGRVKANAAIVPAGLNGAVSVFVNNTSNVLIDIDGYFAPSNLSSLQFHALTPCRVVDTRNANGDLAGPFLTGNQERNFPVLESSCIPAGANAAAYSFNVTAVPHPTGQRLGFLTIWPEGETRPDVSTLNNPTGTIVANAAIVPAGSGGGVTVFPNNDTDLLIDINGYFSVGGSDGLSLYPTAPCRVLDTRDNNGQPFQGQLVVPIQSSVCQPPSVAQAYVFNATVVPPGQLGFLTLWPDGENRPDASTLNAKDGAITSNMAIVPTTNGSIDAYANGLTQLILDISSYFAP